MTSMDRIDAIRLAMSAHFVYLARRDGTVPTKAELIRLHTEAWEDLLDDLVRAARPFVGEDGTWSRAQGGQVVIEHVGLDDVLAAARYASIQTEAAARGDHALGRAVNDALRTAGREILAESAEALHQALAAEHGI